MELLSYVDKTKVLGLHLGNSLKWNTQVHNMLKKANKRLFMLPTLKRFGFSSDELRVVYGGYVRPIIEYADVSLSNNPETSNPSKAHEEEHVALFLGIYANHMLMFWAAANLTLCLKEGRTTVIGLLKAS